MTGHDRSLMIKKPAATPTRHNDLTQSGPEPESGPVCGGRKL